MMIHMQPVEGPSNFQHIRTTRKSTDGDLDRIFETEVLTAVFVHDNRSRQRIHLLNRDGRMTCGQYLGTVIAKSNASTNSMAYIDETLAGARERMGTTWLGRRRISPHWSTARVQEAKFNADLVRRNRVVMNRFHENLAREHERRLRTRDNMNVHRLQLRSRLFESNMARLREEHWRRAGVSMFRNPGHRRLKDGCLTWYQGTPARVEEVLAMARMRVPAARLKKSICLV